ncbi:MAG: class I SAM-dependent methyltransferase [Bacteroidetes bacterium]|nr:class I SAM-dependent methyltransferase [Bacteroidota bacterium]
MLPLSDDIENYIAFYSAHEDEVLRELSRETHLKIQMPQMLSGNIQGQFLEMFSRLLQPKRILEIGTFTGYSAICLAKGLHSDGLLYTLDINEELKAMCEKYFHKANLQHKITHLIGDAKKIIPQLDETFDLVFIDADKINYSLYYDLVFDKVRTGGYIIADNVLWSGKVVEPKKDKDTVAIDAYNQKVAADSRVHNFILPLRDGLNIARKTV